MTRKVTIGFDPGKEGAWACLVDDGGAGVTGFHFNGNELDVANIFEALTFCYSTADDVLLVIEKVHAMPGQGTVSMFTFGSGFGELKSLAKILRHPWTLVPPQTWKKHVLAGTDKSKGATVEWALRTYPKLHDDLVKKSGLAHMGKVDALAIAHYGHHFHPR